jgi:hypothetical protein
MYIKEHIMIPQLEVRITVLDVIQQSSGRPPKYLVDFCGTILLWSERAMTGWRWTAACWDRSGVEVEHHDIIAPGGIGTWEETEKSSEVG